MITIDEIMVAVELYGNKVFAAGASWPASNGDAAHAAFDLIKPLITQALAEARADGAREMREAAESALDDLILPDGFFVSDIMGAINDALSLPAKRELVRLTDAEIAMALHAWAGADPDDLDVDAWREHPDGVQMLEAARVIETAVLAANGLEVAR